MIVLARQISAMGDMVRYDKHTDSIYAFKELYDRDIFRPFSIDTPQGSRFDDLHDLIFKV